MNKEARPAGAARVCWGTWSGVRRDASSARARCLWFSICARMPRAHARTPLPAHRARLHRQPHLVAQQPSPLAGSAGRLV